MEPISRKDLRTMCRRCACRLRPMRANKGRAYIWEVIFSPTNTLIGWVCRKADGTYGVSLVGIQKMAERLRTLKTSLPPWWFCVEHNAE